MKYLHTTSLADANTKSIAICIAIATLSLSSGCDLPLCNPNQVRCELYIHTTYDNCAALCKPDSNTKCPDECYCDGNDINADNSDCKSYYAHYDFPTEYDDASNASNDLNTSAKCTLLACQNDNWVKINDCKYGFENGKCKSECINNDFRCVPNDLTDNVNTNDNVSSECQLQRCEIGDNSVAEWKDIKICKYGFENDNCKSECINNDFRCIPNNLTNNENTNDNVSSECQLQRCEIGDNSVAEWKDIKTCKYGFNKMNAECINPCDICAKDSNCPQSIYDQKNDVIYKCDADNGWTVDNSCFNDFTKDNVQPTINWGEQTKYLPEGLKDKPVEPDSVPFFGHCGECSADNSPVYCAKQNEQYIVHACENGEYVRKNDENHVCEPESDERNLATCEDDYGAVLVDLNSNRNHCGECGNKCSSMQKCIEGRCNSTISCDDGDITQIQLGARWVQALCVGSVETLKEIGQHKVDAYVLIDDISINDPWQPIEGISNVMLLGNDKTITLKNGFLNEEDNNNEINVGIFSKIENCYVESLSLVCDDLTMSSVSNFGALAAIAKDSIVKDLKIKLKANVGAATTAGGLFGEANNVSIERTALNIDLKADNSSQTENNLYEDIRNYGTSGVGGLIGVCNNIKDITNISTFADVIQMDSEKALIEIDADYNVGGICGSLNASQNLTIFDNLNVPFKSVHITATQNLGGVIGQISSYYGPVVTLKNFIDVSDIHLTLKDVYLHYRNAGSILGNTHIPSIASPSLNIVLDLSSIKPNDIIVDAIGGAGANITNVGGIAGNVQNLTADSLSVVNMNISNGDSMMLFSGIGGAFGNVEKSQLNNVVVDNVKINREDSNASDIGGIAGMMMDSTLNNAKISNFSFKSSSDVCNNVGGAIGKSLKNSISNIILGIKSETDDNNNSKFHYDIDIQCKSNAGGLIGSSSGDIIKNINAQKIDITDNAPKKANSFGGLAGYVTNGVVSNIILNDVKLTGYSVIGGLLGKSKDTTANRITINSSITAKAYIGGFIAESSGDINISDAIIMSTINSDLEGTYPPGGFYTSSFINEIKTDSTLTADMVLIYSNIHIKPIGNLYNLANGVITLLSRNHIINLSHFMSFVSTHTDVYRYKYAYCNISDDFTSHTFTSTMNIFNIYETGEKAENHSSIAYFKYKNIEDNDNNYEERNCLQDQNKQYDINYTDGDNVKDQNQYQCCTKPDESDKNKVECSYGNSDIISTDNDCSLLFHELSCKVSDFYASLNCGSASKLSGQALKESNCGDLFTKLIDDKNLTSTSMPNEFKLRVPIISLDEDESVDVTCNKNMQSTCGELSIIDPYQTYRTIPLCLDDTRPACASNNTPTCTDGSTPKCYKIMVPSFCSLND